MSGVSARALSAILEAAPSERIALADLFDGLPISPAVLESPGERIEWEDFATIIDRLADRVDGPSGLIAVGESISSKTGLRVLRVIGRAVTNPRDLYVAGTRWIGPRLFPMLEATIEETREGLLVQRLTLQSNHRSCPALFYVIQGSLASSLRNWGHGRSEVSLRIDGRRATYLIRPHNTRIGLLSRAVRSLRRRKALEDLSSEFDQQRVEIHASYREIREARDRVAAYAHDLERINAFGRELSEEIELERVADSLGRMLIVDLGLAGIDLELVLDANAGDQNGEEASRPDVFRRREGACEGEPGSSFDLVSAGRSIGALRIWNADREDDGTPTEALVEQILPWITIALDNARTYEALERHAADLEHRIEERTTRLLAANHQLVREIDERKRATDALLRSEAQLRESERLAAIGTLAAGIAHEINNPIGSILAAAQFAQLIGREQIQPPEIETALRDIVVESKRCGEIVRSVLQFSREERTEKWDCELREIVRRASRLAESFATEHRAELDVVLPDQPVWAVVNPIQIEQALVNLIRNAVEAGSASIRISLEERYAERTALIEVLDDGSGLAAGDATRIFEPFYTTRRTDGGTGLGLSVVHGISAEHNGSLKIDSSEGGGACALLELPTIPDPALRGREGLDAEKPKDDLQPSSGTTLEERLG